MDEFNSLNELYTRCKPALRTKCNDLRRIGINNIQTSDIWNYLKNNIWNKKNNLSLADIVDDIMTVSNNELINYVKTLKNEKDVEQK